MRIIQAQAQANRINQFTPFGSLTFPQQNVANLEFTPELQTLFDQRIGLDTSLLGAGQQAIPGIESLIEQPLSLEGLPEIGTPTAPGDIEAFRSDVERAFFDRSAGLLSEQFGRQEDRLRQRLANQGLQVGGEAFGDELGIFNQRRGETFENLARDAVLLGGQEASRQLGLESEALRNQANLRSQLFGEQGAVRANQFNELASLLGLQQVQPPGLESFFGPGQINAVDPFALEQQSLQNTFNTQSNLSGNKKGAGANLAGTLGSAFLLR